MTTPFERAKDFVSDLGSPADLEGLKARLQPLDAKTHPLPPSLPHHVNQSEARLKVLEARLGRLSALRGEAARLSPEDLAGNIENYIGMVQVPLGVMGPLRVRGIHAGGDYYVPLATSEGALVASYSRGARLASLSGGVSCVSLPGWVQRAPGFAFEGVAEAASFAAWVIGEFEAMQKAAATTTSHGKLVQMSPHMEGNHVHLILSYTTGAAAGQNMVTLSSQAVCQDLIARSPIKPKHWFVEANMSGDKKATVQSLLNTRGRKVVAEARIPKALVEKWLHTSVERLCDYWRMSFAGGAMSGSIGVSGHVSNLLAALFLATGQDIACVSEASIGITRMEQASDGGLFVSVTLPNLIVGSVGGGTRLPTAAECLKMLECDGEQGADKLAEIAAAAALCGELSIIGALCAGEFASAHARLGRRKA